MKSLRVALLYNLKHHVKVRGDAPPDALAEYDSEETARGLEAALRAGGHEVFPLEADVTLFDTVRQIRPDLCFNIAEGMYGDAREAHAPAVLEMLEIPYTGSKVLAQGISLDKAMTKRVWRDAGLPTAPFQVFYHGDEPLDPALTFPLFVKPVREGSGMGVSTASKVQDEAALRLQVRWVLQTYHQPALVEVYLPGREFTVGLIGNTLTPGEMPRSTFFNQRGFHVLPILEVDVSPIAEAEGIYTGTVKADHPLDANYRCPAPLEAEQTAEMQELAIRAFEAIGGLDVARVDFRMDAAGRLQLLEINTLPGVNPRYSDIVLAARGEGLAYNDLINEILQVAAVRYGLL